MTFYTVSAECKLENMSNDQQIIIDSDAFIGLMHKTDALHEQAIATYQYLKEQLGQFATTRAVVTETATLLSHRRGQSAACKLLEDFIDSGAFPVVFITEALYQQGLEIFKVVSRIVCKKRSASERQVLIYTTFVLPSSSKNKRRKVAASPIVSTLLRVIG